MKNQFLIKATSSLFIGFSIVALSLSSCKKDDDPENDYKISFKVDDVLEEFTSKNSPSAFLMNEGTPARLTVDSDKTSSVIALVVFDMKKLVEAEYKGLKVKQSDTQYSVIGAQIGYQKNKTSNYASGRLASSDVSITITKMTSKTVSGKFSGRLYGAEDAEIVITDGEFFVPMTISKD